MIPLLLKLENLQPKLNTGTFINKEDLTQHKLMPTIIN